MNLGFIYVYIYLFYPHQNYSSGFLLEKALILVYILHKGLLLVSKPRAEESWQSTPIASSCTSLVPEMHRGPWGWPCCWRGSRGASWGPQGGPRGRCTELQPPGVGITTAGAKRFGRYS